MLKELQELCNAPDAIEAQKAADKLRLAAETAVNTFSLSPRKLVAKWLEEADEKGREMLTEFAVAWVYTWGTKKNPLADGRNEMAVEKCVQIAEKDCVQQYVTQHLLETIATGHMAACMNFADRQGPRMHRTLMQSFTSVVLQILEQTHPEWELSVPERLPLI